MCKSPEIFRGPKKLLRGLKLARGPDVGPPCPSSFKSEAKDQSKLCKFYKALQTKKQRQQMSNYEVGRSISIFLRPVIGYMSLLKLLGQPEGQAKIWGGHGPL